jgi:hypothetical protein
VLRVCDAASGQESEVRSREVVNAAGLHAPAVAAAMAGLPQRLVPRAHYARGHYFSLKGAQMSPSRSLGLGLGQASVLQHQSCRNERHHHCEATSCHSTLPS